MEWPIRNPKAMPWHGHGKGAWGRHPCSHHRRALSMEWPMPWPWGRHPWSAHRRALPMEWPIRKPNAMPWHLPLGMKGERCTMQPPIEEPCPWNSPFHGHRGHPWNAHRRALPMEWPIRNPKAMPWHGHGKGAWGRHPCSHHRRALSMEWPMPWPWGRHPWSAHRRALPMEWPIRKPKAMPWHLPLGMNGGCTLQPPIEEPCP